MHVIHCTCMLHIDHYLCQHAKRLTNMITAAMHLHATCMSARHQQHVDILNMHVQIDDMNVLLGCWHVVDVDIHLQGIDIHVTRSKCPFIVSCHRSRDPRLHCVSQWPPLAGPTHNTLASVSHTDSTYTSLAYPQKTCRRA